MEAEARLEGGEAAEAEGCRLLAGARWGNGEGLKVCPSERSPGD